MTRQIINPWTWQDQVGFVQGHAVGGGRTVYRSGQTSVDADGNPVHEGDMAAQMTQALDNVEAVLRESGASLVGSSCGSTTTRPTSTPSSPRRAPWWRGCARRCCRPTATLLGVSRLAFPALLVEIEATAVTD